MTIDILLQRECITPNMEVQTLRFLRYKPGPDGHMHAYMHARTHGHPLLLLLCSSMSPSVAGDNNFFFILLLWWWSRHDLKLEQSSCGLLNLFSKNRWLKHSIHKCGQKSRSKWFYCSYQTDFWYLTIFPIYSCILTTVTCIKLPEWGKPRSLESLEGTTGQLRSHDIHTSSCMVSRTFPRRTAIFLSLTSG